MPELIKEKALHQAQALGSYNSLKISHTLISIGETVQTLLFEVNGQIN